MSARKVRPKKGDEITPEMSRRDVAAALGISKSELQRWRDLGRMPEEEFERRLAEQVKHASKRHVSAASILQGVPVPSRGRVDRAKGLFTAMNEAEKAEFIVWVMLEAAAPKESAANILGGRAADGSDNYKSRAEDNAFEPGGDGDCFRQRGKSANWPVEQRTYQCR